MVLTVRMRLLSVAMLALAASACGPPPGDPGSLSVEPAAEAVASCDEIERISAPEERYRDSPVYVANEMPVEELRAWAADKPGFEEIWIDRDRRGWITLAFSHDAAARQAELEDEFSDVGVVAVGVDWTMAELEDLQRRVIEQLGPIFPVSSGISGTQGVVTIHVGVLTAERAAAVGEHFAGEPVCLEGTDPADAPSEGPQPDGGEGWRLLADEQGAGQAYRTGIAADERSYELLWAEAGLSGTPPEVDFDAEVVVWFGAVYSSGCPDLRLDGVVVDPDAGVLHADIVLVDSPAACNADANPHAYLVAVQRALLPRGPFAIQLDADGPPNGVPEERTLVEADLSRPGATATDGQIGPDISMPHQSMLGWDDIMEPDVAYPYRLYTHCGVEWLGNFNGTAWRTQGGAVPPEWRSAVGSDQYIEVSVILETAPEPAVTATANGHSVVYVPSDETPDGCD